MTRVVVFCPDTIDLRMAGVALRQWELAHALARHGFDVTLAVPDATQRTSETVALAVHGFQDGACARLAAAADVVVLQGFMLFHAPVLRQAERPMAVDLCTPFVIENLETHRYQSPSERLRFHRTDLAVLCDQLRRGDFFFCAGERQREYWLGMLGALGRLTAGAYAADHTLRRLIDVVSFGLPAHPPRHTRNVLKGVVPGIGLDDRVLLWGGGVWEWFDPLTPIRGLARAVKERPELKLYFMTRGHPNPRLTAAARAPMYDRAVALAGELGLAGRHVFFNDGWVPYDERENYLLEADAGISAHGDHVETELAVRTRLFDYIWADLPMLVSGGDGLSADVVSPAGLGTVLPVGDDAAWAEALLALVADPERRARLRPAFAQLKAELTWDRVAAPLAAYCARAGLSNR